MGHLGSRRADPANLRWECVVRCAVPSRRAMASAARLRWSVGLPLHVVPPMAGGNDMLKAGGVVHPWGRSAVRSPQRRGDAIFVMTMLGAQPLSWQWIDTGFKACRSSTALAVGCVVLQGSGIAVDAGAAQASFLGLQLVSLWS
jgi:hypothetical protein